jgi:mycofactocin system glycosyltransferase
MVPSQLPEDVRIEVADDLRIHDEQRSVIGGVPLRILRLSNAGIRVVRSMGASSAAERTAAVRRLERTLLDAGMANPVPAAGAWTGTVGVVTPVFDGAELLAVGLPDDTVVVHDAGPNRDLIGERCQRSGFRLVEHAANAGPAAARNTGSDHLDTDVVVFVDTDVELSDDVFSTLLDHFADPQVAAVAPRVRASRGTGLLTAFEQRRSPLDLGARPATVRPDGVVSHVPAAVLAVRSTAFAEVGGFDAELRFGEDVDLVWRLADRGWTVRYAPEVVARHASRSSWRALWRQRRGYGSAAAPLDARHSGAAAPVRLNAWSALSWAVLAFGRGPLRLGGLVVWAASTATLARRLDGVVEQPAVEALRLGGKGTAVAGTWLAKAITRAWLPLALVAATVSRRARRLLLAAFVVPSVSEWVNDRPAVNPATWILLCAADDASYCVGVWEGMVRLRSAGAIRPRFTSIPGLSKARGNDKGPPES